MVLNWPGKSTNSQALGKMKEYIKELNEGSAGSWDSDKTENLHNRRPRLQRVADLVGIAISMVTMCAYRLSFSFKC